MKESNTVRVSIDAVNSAVLTCALMMQTYRDVAESNRKTAHSLTPGQMRMRHYYRESACTMIAKAQSAKRAGQRLMRESLQDMNASAICLRRVS